MQNMIKIAFLVEHPDSIPTLSEWFRAQWPEYFGERTPAEIAQDFHAEANRHRLPVRLVAFADGELAGTVCLRESAMDILPEYRPGLGGLYVVERHRGRGIGAELVSACMNVAREQGYDKVYATTAAARGILERLGWQRVRDVTHGDEQLVLYGCDLGSPPPAAQ